MEDEADGAGECRHTPNIARVFIRAHAEFRTFQSDPQRGRAHGSDSARLLWTRWEAG